jgi:hypothetical protein
VLKRFFSPLWWRHVLAFSWQFRRYLLAPALFFLLFSMIETPTMTMLKGIHAGSDGITDAGPLISKLLIAMVGFSSAGILFLLGMFLGVLRLTAFTRAYLFCPLPLTVAAMKEAAYKTHTETCQREAVEAMSKQKAYLARAWLIATLVMLPGIFIACLAGAMSVIWSAPDRTVLSFPLPPELHKLAIYPQIVASIAGVMLNNYSVVTMAVTSMTNRTIGEATRQSMLLAFTTAPLMTAVSIFVLALTSLVTTPYEVANLLHPTGQLSTPGTLPIAMAWEAWQVISGIMVYPIGTAFLTEVVRDLIVVDDSAGAPGATGAPAATGTIVATGAEVPHDTAAILEPSPMPDPPAPSDDAN